jgi:galactokinase
VKVFAPGRVNLIGDHVDYVGGLVLPMAVDLGTTIEVHAGGSRVRLDSADEPDPAELDLPVGGGAPPCDIADIEPPWARFVGAVLAELGATTGFEGTVTSTLPVGAGLSSSSSFTIAVALAAGFDGSSLELARLALRAEVAATGVPGGLMDQLVITHAAEGSALLIDCRDNSTAPVALPPGTVAYAVHSGVARRLAGSAYAERRASCEAAEKIVGPLRDANLDDLAAIDDRTMRARARHVITENARVRSAAAAAEAGDAATFGRLMDESHASLRDDFAVSIPELDHLVERLRTVPGVHGARLTGAGFGGCAVALADESADPEVIGGWRLRPSGAARVIS